MEIRTFFRSKGDKIQGTLTLPDDINQPPICLFVGGSFPQTRDGNLDNSQTDWFPVPLPERNIFKDEACLLEKIGIATFRYDKRGSGESEGDFNLTSLLDLLDDARNALQWLRNLPEIDETRIGVLGQSEGAYLALMLAAAEPSLSFYIWQGGIYNNLETILRWQTKEFWQLDANTINNFKQNMPLVYWIYRQIDQIWSSVKQGHTYFKLGDDLWSKDFYLPLCKEHLDYPPSQFANQIKCPVLLLHGELDHNTPYTEALLMEKALIESGNNQVTTHIFPGLDHSFRRLGKPDEDFVTAMQRPLDGIMSQVLVNWLETTILSNFTQLGREN
ncbi:MAG TPA: alpha/beta hydrolase [Cyanothece sp. UBA12306]|nr:alpha/beta hydrolase [Cyanothece sp. UBA12306]